MHTIHRLYSLYERNFEAIELLNEERQPDPELLASYVQLTRDVAKAIRREVAKAQQSVPGLKAESFSRRARA
jgi:hypothetical protein